MGDLGGVRWAGWVRTDVEGTPVLAAGVERIRFWQGDRHGGWVRKGAGSVGGHTGGDSSVRKVAVGLEPVGDTVLKLFFHGNPANWFLLEVDSVVVEGDILNGLDDLGSCFGHFAGEVVEIATSVLPTLGEEGDEYLVVFFDVRGVVSRVGGKHVQARVGVGGAVVRDESQGFGYDRVGVDVGFVSTFRPQGCFVEPGG